MCCNQRVLCEDLNRSLMQAWSFWGRVCWSCCGFSQELDLSLELSAAGCVSLSACERGRDEKVKEDTVL